MHHSYLQSYLERTRVRKLPFIGSAGADDGMGPQNESLVLAVAKVERYV